MVFLTPTGFTNPEVYRVLEEYSVIPIKRTCIIAAGLLPQKNAHPVARNTYSFLAEKGIEDLFFFDPDHDDPNMLSNCDLVTILGGDSCRLFNSLKKSGTDVVMKEIAGRGAHLVGASAGAMFLSSGNEYTKHFGPIIGIEENAEELIDPEGLGFTDDILFPHYDMFLQRVPDLDRMLNGIEEKYHIKITRLKNMEFIYVDPKGHRVFVKL